ncbi:TetR/AcrR family transcriptional regulator [Chengkuizengella sediminis]|uniref:TetR/AcrR family transcriptional regulator n=1 Tax=Chengkuizengella sediminis TaxID=1885917 RepID=UPI00138A6C54|nr:helix-turn-helix domain-containing protein [Chengkuizengella sediminis]NDI33148.1 helix-turn-helix transcriptional regulator [Chengkuizengella sediminis]
MGKLSTKEKIINASLELFSEKGYKATTIKEIAEKVGMKELTVYRHFGKKEKILERINTMITTPLPIIESYLENEAVYHLEQDLSKILTIMERELNKNKQIIKFICREKIDLPDKYLNGKILVEYFDIMKQKGKIKSSFEYESLTLLFFSSILTSFILKERFKNEKIAFLIENDQYKETIVSLFTEALKSNNTVLK